MSAIRNILIVGGGTSGWLSAAYLARRLGCGKKDGARITLIEATDIPTIGVGEATIPPIRVAISSLGLDEARFMRESSATFKMAIRFDDWLRLPKKGKGRAAATGHRYYHAFGPFGQIGLDTMAPYWLKEGRKSGKSFVDYSMIEGRLCEAGRGPKRLTDAQYGGPVEYAYHFDAGRLAVLLKKVARDHGVKHLLGKVDRVILDDAGSIASVETAEHGSLKADLYIDCTGFSAHLIEKALGSEFRSITDTLFCDRAIACQAPMADPHTPIPPFTISTAHENGWTWDIPLNNRRGVGYVYSSKYSDDERAMKVLLDYLGPDGKDLKYWPIKIRVGSRPRQWVGNCVSIGLSAGFIEPLESTGIYLVDIALRWLADLIQPTGQMTLAASQFNRRMNDTYADIIDFIKLHYALSRRTDTDFWIDNQRPETMPDSLIEKLDAWRHRVPGVYEFSGLPNVFGLTNYMQIMYGMDYLPDLKGQGARFGYGKAAKNQSERLAAAAKGGIETLPDHRRLIDDIYNHGFKTPPPGAGI